MTNKTFHCRFFNRGMDRNDVLLYQLQRAGSERDLLVQVVGKPGSLEFVLRVLCEAFAGRLCAIKHKTGQRSSLTQNQSHSRII